MPAKKLVVSTYLQYVVLALGLVLLFGFVRQLSGVLLTFLAAAVLAYALNPLVRRLEGWKVPRALAVTGIFLVLIVLVLVGMLVLMMLQQRRSKRPRPKRPPTKIKIKRRRRMRRRRTPHSHPSYTRRNRCAIRRRQTLRDRHFRRRTARLRLCVRGR